MNPILLYFADGTVFFIGLTLVLLSVALLGLWSHRFMRVLAMAGSFLGVILVIISATPLPFLAYLLWGTIVVLALLVCGRFRGARKFMFYSWLLLLIVTGALAIWEMSHHQRPEIVVSKETAIYVIGDSISAGMGAGIIVWPQVLAEQAMLRVVNLAQPGAKVRDGIRQAEQISEAPALVILEIGGNDLLGDTDASSFRADLDILVQELVGHGHSVLMMELPLFPFQNGYGEAQREIAAEYDVQLLPKRALTQVLGVPGSTSDGLHLSQVGHNAMAEVLVEVMKLR